MEHGRSLFILAPCIADGLTGLVRGKYCKPICSVRSNLRESFARGFDRTFNEFIGMRGGDKSGLKLRRGEVYAFVEHGMEESGEAIAIAAIRRRPIAHRL